MRMAWLALSTPNPQSLGARIKGSESSLYRDSTHISVREIAAWRESIARAGFEAVDDGTDTLWDPPYLPIVPRKLQWAAFLALSHTMWLLRFTYPWHLGENYVCIARKRAERAVPRGDALARAAV